MCHIRQRRRALLFWFSLDPQGPHVRMKMSRGKTRARDGIDNEVEFEISISFKRQGEARLAKRKGKGENSPRAGKWLRVIENLGLASLLQPHLSFAH